MVLDCGDRPLSDRCLRLQLALSVQQLKPSQNSESRRDRATLLVPRLRLQCKAEFQLVTGQSLGTRKKCFWLHQIRLQSDSTEHVNIHPDAGPIRDFFANSRLLKQGGSYD